MNLSGRYLLSDFCSDHLRESDLRIKEINLSLRPSLWEPVIRWILLLSICSLLLLPCLFFLCFFFKLLVQIIEYIEVIADIILSPRVNNGIMWRPLLDHYHLTPTSFIVLDRWSHRCLPLRVALHADVGRGLLALHVDYVADYVVSPRQLGVFPVLLDFLPHIRVVELRSSHCTEVLKEVRLCHARVAVIKLQVVVVGSTIEKLLMIFSQRGVILTSLLDEIGMRN